MADRSIRTLVAAGTLRWRTESRHGMDYMSGEVNVLALVRGEEQYIFIFDPARRTDLLRLLGRYAADPDLSFNWFDAAVLSHKIRELMPATVTASLSEPTQSAPMSGPTKGVMRSPRFQIPRP